MSWDEYRFKKGKMSFIAQDFNTNEVLTILDGRTQAVIRNHFLRYPRQVRRRVKVITMDMFSPYYQLAKQLFPHAQIVLDHVKTIQNDLGIGKKLLGQLIVRTEHVHGHHFDPPTNLSRIA